MLPSLPDVASANNQSIQKLENEYKTLYPQQLVGRRAVLELLFLLDVPMGITFALYFS